MKKPWLRWAVIQGRNRIVWMADLDTDWHKKGAREAKKAFETIPLKPKPCRVARVEIREIP